MFRAHMTRPRLDTPAGRHTHRPIRSVAISAMLALLVLSGACDGEARLPAELDPYGLATPREYRAFRSSSNNPDELSNDDSLRPLPGETVVLADLDGPGVIQHMWITVADNEYAWPRLLRLRVYYDGSAVPSVDAPLGDFFGVGHGMERPLSSLIVRAGSSGRSRNEYWPMPFKRSARVTITNEGRRRLANLYFHVDWSEYPSLPDDVPYFHARYRQALPTRPGAPYEILKTRGRGHYVGTVFSVVQNEPGWFGEGDDLFYVDGDPTPVMEGTGTEDYFNDAWSLRVDDGPYAGVTVADGTGLGSRMTAYRWHVESPIPFTEELRFDIEHAGWTFNADGSVRSAFEERQDLFSSVAFWYQYGIAMDQPEPPYGSARLPHGNATQIEVEENLAGTSTVGGTVEVQEEVFWSKDILFFQADGPGSRIDVPFDVPETGTYELIASLAKAPDYGRYRVLIDGRPPGEGAELEHEPGANLGAGPAIENYFHEIYVGEDHVLGWPHLTEGTHSVSFVNAGRSPESTGFHLGIDALVLARVAGEAGDAVRDSASVDVLADRIRRWGEAGVPGEGVLEQVGEALSNGSADERIAAAWALTQFKGAASPLTTQLVEALGSPDHVLRGLAAVALRDMGSLSEDVIDRVAERLEADRDDGVRMMLAWAIAAQGEGGLRTMPTLMKVGVTPGLDAHVQRAIADAFGAMGPAAADAAPVLDEMYRNPRSRWNVEAARRRIFGDGG